MNKAARAVGAKAMLSNTEVSQWFASSGLQGADVAKKLKTEMIRTSKNGNSAEVRVFLSPDPTALRGFCPQPVF